MHPSSVSDFKGINVLVIGDLMLDTYYWGIVNRISPEAPVPIVSVNKIERRLGGAGNVISNLKSLEALPFIASVIGTDSTSSHIKKLIEEANIKTEYILFSNNRVSTEKIRVINETKHIVRCDIENDTDISHDEEVALLNGIKKCLDTHPIKVIVLQDYNKGVLTENLILSIIQIASEKNIPITVDPKKKNFFAYKNVFLFKPNLKEVKEALDIDINPTDKHSLLHAANILFERLNCENVFITLSEHGAFYMNKAGEHQIIPAHARKIVDVSGAGDTVISVATLCVANKIPIHDIAILSNLAGGIVCEEPGVACLSLAQLNSYIIP